MMAWADVIDALAEDNGGRALELAVRRYVGVRESDRYGNWALADALQLERSAGSLINRDIELAVLTAANGMARAVNTATRGRFANAQSGRAGRYPYPNESSTGQPNFGRGRGMRRGRGRGRGGGAAPSANGGGAADE